MRKDVVIIHYNTPELTKATIQSLRKHTDCNVYVFDNSDERPFVADDSVTIIDNTKGQLINFDKFLARHRDKVPNRSNWGSTKHCLSVDRCFDLIPGGFLLVDSDVLIKKDVSPLFDNRFAWVGGIHTNTRRFNVTIFRVIPYLCYLNVPMIRKYCIRYFNASKMWFLNSRVPDMYYDTGAWLYEECLNKGLMGEQVDIEDYALHFRHGSWKEKDGMEWLEANKELWKY